VGAAAVVAVYLPLRQLARTTPPFPGRRRFAVFFVTIALGYLAIEVALLQRFGLFLGHPNYSLSVVLAALLVSTGVGSLLSEGIVARLGNVRYAAYALAGVLFQEHLYLLPRLMSWVGLSFAVRAAVVAVLIAPIGIMLGVFFPSGLQRLKAAAPALAPWAWGVNGIFSVLAPILSVAISMTWGIGALLLAAIPVYLLASFALPEPSAS
jgi:hypothetical protein